MTFTPEAQELAKRIVHLFESGRVVHNQNNWVYSKDADDLDALHEEENLCKTTMCIAGGAVFLSEGVNGLIESEESPYDRYKSFPGKGAHLLDLKPADAHWLFYETEDEDAMNAVEAIANNDYDEFSAIMTTDLNHEN